MDMFNPAHEAIADIIRKVTNEQTLTQLYFDWNIVKQPKQLIGGDHMLMKWISDFHPELQGITKESKLPKELLGPYREWKKENERPISSRERSEMAANSFWLEVKGRLYDQGCRRKTYAFLDQDTLFDVQDLLTELTAEIKTFIKQG